MLEKFLTDMQNQALDLAKQGFRVFPVRRNSKVPGVEDWPNVATTDLAQVKRWWALMPGMNIGIVPGPDFFVLDIDKKVPQHRKSVEKLRALGLPAPLMTVKTPGGGLHLYYRHPGGGIIKASDPNWTAEFSGVDIRADNAYVVAPGSVYQGKTYKVLRNGIGIQNG